MLLCEYENCLTLTTLHQCNDEVSIYNLIIVTESICYWYAPNFPLYVCICTHIHIHPQISQEDVDDFDSSPMELQERVHSMSYPPRVLLDGEDPGGWIFMKYPQCQIPDQRLTWGLNCEFLYIYIYLCT